MRNFDYSSPQKVYENLIRNLAENAVEHGHESVDAHDLTRLVGKYYLDGIVQDYIDALPSRDKEEYEHGDLQRNDALEVIVDDVNNRIPVEIEDKEYWAAVSASAANAGLSERL